jgi:serine/threonine protein kinase
MSEDDRTYQPSKGSSSGKAVSALQIAPGAVLKDTYRIDAELGSGGMGTVYQATHLGLEKTMAVKVLSPKAISSPESLARFTREARVAGKVNHPAMTAVIDFGVEQGTPYIVMEYVDGVELAEVIERQGPMPPRQAVAVMRQIVSLLHAAHALGIVHRDLKPSNIKVVRAGPADGQLFVKVLVFGIAKVLGDVAGQLTSEGMMVGTPAYMAPEQIAAKPIDGRTDLYAAGLIFYELLSGKRAFKGDTIARILHAQMSEPPPPLALPLPEVLRQTLEKFYEKNPEDRFQDAAEADRALIACEEALRASPVDTGAVRESRQGASDSMVRPDSVRMPSDAADSEGGFSATMRRPESGAAGETKLKPGTPLPPRPITDRQPITPLPSDRAGLPPAPIPPPMPSGTIVGPPPVQGQRSGTSGWVKGCLIAGAVVFMGCLGLSFLGYLASLGAQQQPQQQEEDSRFNTPIPPPAGQVAYAGNSPTAQPDRGDDDPEPSPAVAPGCYVSEAVLGSAADEEGNREPWELMKLVSRSKVACPSGRQKAPDAQALELAESWPDEEEILQVEQTFPPQRSPDEPDVFIKGVRVRTRVSGAPR